MTTTEVEVETVTEDNHRVVLHREACGHTYRSPLGHATVRMAEMHGRLLAKLACSTCDPRP